MVASETRPAVASFAPLGRRSAVAWLSALVMARAGVYLVLGASFVGDDRGFVARGVLLGIRSVGSEFRAGRPGAGVTYDIVYGLAGEHPVVLFALVTLLNLAVVLALFVALTRFVSNVPAFLVSAAWLVMANHNSLTVWGATAPTLVALLLVLLGVIATVDRRWIVAGLLFAGAILSYELVAPVAAAALVVAVVRDRRDLRAQPLLIVTGVAVVVTTIWTMTHSIYPADLRVPDLQLLVLGHFGTALVGGPAPPGIVEVAPAIAVVVGAVLAGVAWLLGERGRDDGPSLAVAGIAVMALGLPVAFTLPIRSFGVSDRLYAVSSVGAAMIVVGVGMWVWRHRPVLATVGAVAAVALCLYGGVVSLRAWSEAGADGVAITRGLAQLEEHPEQVDWVLGPVPPERDQVIVMQSWDGNHALDLTYGPGSGSLRVAAEPGEFEVLVPGERLVRWEDLLASGGS